MDLIDVHSLACLTTIDRQRTKAWEGGFQLYFNIPQWVAGARISVRLGSEVTAVQECWGVMQSCTEMPATCDRNDADDGDLLSFDRGELSFFLKTQTADVACVLKGTPPLAAAPIRFDGAPNSSARQHLINSLVPPPPRAIPASARAQAPIAQHHQHYHPHPLACAQRQRSKSRAERQPDSKAM